MKSPAAALLTLVLVACGTSPSPQSQGSAPSRTQGVDANSAQVPLAFSKADGGLEPFKGTPIDPAQLWPPQSLPQALPSLSLAAQAQSHTVRVYYSDPLPLSSAYRDGGQFDAILLSNLLGQYNNVKVIRAPISQYVAGDAQNSDRTFYIGTVFGENLPSAFLSDVQAGAPVTWMGYNIWALGSNLSKLGLNYVGLHTALTDTEIAATFNTVNYKNYAYRKYPAQQEMIEVKADPARTQTLATAQNAAGEQIPYLLRSGNFYFVADNPFQYITPTDRYLVLADSLKTMLNDSTTGKCSKQAVLRLEDLSALNNPAGLQAALDVIQELNIPFAMTVIPQAYYNGVAHNWRDNGGELLQIYRAVKLGGVISQHGYTHNYHGLRVPEGNTAAEWEFWDAENNMPLPTLTPQVTQQRMLTGMWDLLNLGLVPRLWTTPHYQADVSLYPAMTRIYPTALERRMYAADGVRGGQFFPYPVTDQYGTKVLPENLGNVQSDYPPSAILDAAEANKNLSCAYASFFVHPYLLQSDYTGADRLTKATFKAMLQGIQAKGFTFVNPLSIETRTLR